MTASETQIVEFSVTDAAINELAQKYENPKVPQNKNEYEVLKAGIKEVDTIRIAINKERMAQNSAALAHQREVNRVGNDIIEQLKDIASPMKLCIQEVNEAEERALAEKEQKEAARLETIKLRLARIESYGQVSLNDTLEDVKKRLARVEELDPNDRFDEFARKAAEVKEASFLSLHAAIGQIEETLRVAQAQTDQQVELDRQVEELAERERKAKEEQDRLDKEKKDREEAEREIELKRLKSLEDAEAVRKAKEKTEAEEAHQKALAPDKEKLRVFAQSVRELPMPECSSDEGKMAIDRVIEQITTLVFEIESEADRL